MSSVASPRRARIDSLQEKKGEKEGKGEGNSWLFGKKIAGPRYHRERRAQSLGELRVAAFRR